jgi:hypothetical protein
MQRYCALQPQSLLQRCARDGVARIAWQPRGDAGPGDPDPVAVACGALTRVDRRWPALTVDLNPRDTAATAIRTAAR